jgi:hypothetical protein
VAFDAFLADRIRQQLKEKHIPFEELPMMGGLCFKVDGKMLCGIHLDKKFGDNLLMARISEAAYENQLAKPNCLPMDFTGRPMKGYIQPYIIDLQKAPLLEFQVRLTTIP